MKTKAPSSTKRFAVAKPIPLVPPVTTATFPCNLPIIVTFSFFADQACRRNACGPDGFEPQAGAEDRRTTQFVDVERLLGRRANARCSRPYPGRSERKGRGRRSRYAAWPAGSRARGTDGRAATAPGRRHRRLRRRSSCL